MCEDLKPLFSEQQFGYLMAIKAPNFNNEDPFVLKLFETPFQDESIAPQIRKLQENLQRAIEAGRNGEIEAINEFAIDWSGKEEFMAGYLDGMLDISSAFALLLTEVENFIPSEDDASVFNHIVLPWASHWQKKHQQFDLSMAEPVLADEVYENRILIVSKHRGLLIPSEGIHLGHWFELDLFDFSPATVLVDAVWAITPMGDGEGLEIEGRDECSRPISSERIFCTYSFDEICEEHWAAAKQANDEKLAERGFFTLQPMVEHIAGLLQVLPQDFAQDLGDVWDSQDLDFGNTVFMRPSREDVLSASFEESFFGLEPAAGFEINPQNGQITVGSIGASWAGHSLAYHLENLELLDLDDKNLLGALDSAIWEALRQHEQSKKKCSHCQEPTPPYYLAKEGYCYGCGEKHFGAIY